MPIRRIFGYLFNIKEQVDLAQQSAHSAFPKRLNYYLRVRDRAWGWLYKPIAEASFWLSRKVGMLQQGRIQNISDLFVYNYHSASGVCDMKFLPLLIEIMQLLLLLAAAPVFAGWVKMVKCWSQGRTSPSLLQPYRDIAKLF